MYAPLWTLLILSDFLHFDRLISKLQISPNFKLMRKILALILSFSYLPNEKLEKNSSELLKIKQFIIAKKTTT